MTYEEAVQRAKDYFRSPMISRFMAADDARPAKAELLALVLGRSIEDDLEAYIAAARTDRMAYDALKELAAQHIGKEMPPALAEWAQQDFRNPQPPPTGQKPQPEKNNCIVQAVIRVKKDTGIDPTRNPDGKNPKSGCDAIAQALSELGLEPTTYDGVLKIWKAAKGNHLRGPSY